MTKKPIREGADSVEAVTSRTAAENESHADEGSVTARAEHLLRYLRRCAETSEGYAKTARTKQRRLCRAIEAATLSVCIIELRRVLTGEPFGFTLPVLGSPDDVPPIPSTDELSGDENRP